MLGQVLYFSAAYIRFAVEIDMRNKSVAQVSTGSSEVVTLRESASTTAAQWQSPSMLLVVRQRSLED